MLDANTDVVSFDMVEETAYVMPINKVRTDDFPLKEEDIKAYFVVPPKSTWKDIGWNSPLLDINKLKPTYVAR